MLSPKVKAWLKQPQTALRRQNGCVQQGKVIIRSSLWAPSRMRVTQGEPTQTHEHSRLSVKPAALHRLPKSCGLFLAIRGGQWHLFDRQEAAVFSNSIIGTMALERSRFDSWKYWVC